MFQCRDVCQYFSLKITLAAYASRAEGVCAEIVPTHRRFHCRTLVYIVEELIHANGGMHAFLTDLIATTVVAVLSHCEPY